MLLESDADSGSINFSDSSDSVVEYAQEENWNETDKVVQDVDDVTAHDSDAQWIWEAIKTAYRGQKIPFTG
jgi:hypothetical protein